MIVTSGITIQFGAKPLFENISVKFGEGKQVGAAIIDFRGSYEEYLQQQGLA